MKTTAPFLTVLAIFLATGLSASAQSVEPTKTPLRELRKEVRQDLRATRKEMRPIHKKGTITNVSGTTITMTGDKTYTVDASAATLLRRFGGKSTIAEFSVSDEIEVVGKFSNEEETAITARVVRNMSVQKRFGVFFGTVQSVGSSTFIITAETRGNQTINYTSASKIVDRTAKTMAATDIAVGDKVRVKGVWDNKLNTITVADAEREGIKDFSKPVRAEKTPAPSGATSQ